MRPIFIIGFTAVGKTTVGKRLAEKMGLQFIDTDVYIEQRYHTSVGGMMATCGIDKFRKREKVVLIELCQRQDTVIATGGGMPIDDDNIQRMLRSGTVIYLSAPEEVLTKRLISVRESRPTVAGLTDEGVAEHVRQTLPKRTPFYEKAHYTIDVPNLETAEDVDAVVDEIVARLEEA